MDQPPQGATVKVKLPEKYDVLQEAHRFKVFWGGRGGAKSHSFARQLLVEGMRRRRLILCTREIQNSIRDSVHRLLADCIEEMEIGYFYHVTETTIEGLNGTQFIFYGLRFSINSIRSLEGVDICWVEEAAAVSQESWDLLIPTIRKAGSEIWISFNPDEADDPVYQMFIVHKQPEAVVVRVGMEDNPWAPVTLLRHREFLARTDPEKERHIYGGETRRRTEALIFYGKYSIEDFPSPSDIKEMEVWGTRWRVGADWGFSQDPMAIIRSFPRGQYLFIDREEYGLGVELDDMPPMFDRLLPKKRWPVVADSARPETIAFMNRRGYNVVGAKKGKGSVEDGIENIKNYRRVVIHPRCTWTALEFKNYSYKVDPKTGQILPIIIDAFNNCIDGLRYSLEDAGKADPYALSRW